MNTEAETNGYSDDTGPRLRAFLASMRPMVDAAGDCEVYQDGLSAIERLANSAAGEDEPSLRLPVREVADVLNYLCRSRPPKERVRDWWKDPEDAPSHVVGFALLMGALEDSLRSGCSAPGSTTSEADTLRRLLFRLEIASWKLDLARDHWAAPQDIVSGDQGAVAIIREAAAAISGVYCDLQEWSVKHVETDPIPYSWEDLEEPQQEVES